MANNPPPPAIPQSDRIKALQNSKRSLAESGNDKPELTSSSSSSSNNSVGQIKNNGIFNKVFKCGRKNKDPYRKMWSRD